MKPVLAPLLIVTSLSLLILLVFILDNRLAESTSKRSLCGGSCEMSLVESIPENLTYPKSSPLFPSTYSAWQHLLDNAEKSIDLVVFYWSLRNDDVTPIKMNSSWEGEAIFDHLLDIAKTKKEVKIRVTQNQPDPHFRQNDSKLLEKEGAEIRSVDFDRLLGAGVLHTKMWIVDDKNMYLGSTNMDWQSLTQVKEVGVLVQNCSCLVEDAKKIFEVYWILGQNSSKIPPKWPSELSTRFNALTPMKLTLSGHKSDVFLSSSPLPFNPNGRTNDIDTVVSIISHADKFVHIAVMDYFPRFLYAEKTTFWPVIDDELRRASLNKRVKVKLLASHWNHTRADMVRWLKSLQDLSGKNWPSISIETVRYKEPLLSLNHGVNNRGGAAILLHESVPFTTLHLSTSFCMAWFTFVPYYIELNLLKRQSYFAGTSNWSGDYFTNTAGVSISVSEDSKRNETLSSAGNDSSLREQLESLFERDWNSPYAKPLQEFL
ncbi:Phospholipase D3 [Armadillidium nasatum]|uniref:Phospholipase D3 n=1 Tax=Armadillidium nasatum TaxID=96803 RepID=A0A5N5SZ40_9CRUS|nr:Phospholipase D3 [Armadillidium nasatum]